MFAGNKSKYNRGDSSCSYSISPPPVSDTTQPPPPPVVLLWGGTRNTPLSILRTCMYIIIKERPRYVRIIPIQNFCKEGCITCGSQQVDHREMSIFLEDITIAIFLRFFLFKGQLIHDVKVFKTTKDQQNSLSVENRCRFIYLTDHGTFIVNYIFLRDTLNKNANEYIQLKRT